MRRRDLITLLAGAAATWPLAARAQQPPLPVIGVLHAGTPEQLAAPLLALRKGLSEAGFFDGRNVAIESRFAENALDRLPELAADLVRRRAAVILAPGSTPAALAAKAATATIPIVFLIGADPVQAGLVGSLNRPGGNVTGVSSMQTELGAKRIGFLHELLPSAARFAVLVNPSSVASDAYARTAREGVAAIGGQFEEIAATSSRDIATAFASIATKGIDAISIMPDTLFVARQSQLVTLAVHHKVPTIYSDRAFPEAGGLMSYGPDLRDNYRQLGLYAGRILKGERPPDLPVMQPTKFELIINAETARLLDLTIPPSLLAIADQVIE
jgi:putative ABC transport system substrate-binding protein